MQKIVDWIVKIASLIVTAPVTVTVANRVFGDIQPEALRYLMLAASVTLVEGVFLSNWLLLDNKRNANEPATVTFRYALVVTVMYVALLALALQHGEGIGGLVIRLALFFAVMGSAWDTLSTVTLRYITVTRDEVGRAWDVMIHDRNLLRKEMKLIRNTDSQIAAQREKARLQVAFAEIESDTKGQLWRIANRDVTVEPAVTVKRPVTAEKAVTVVTPAVEAREPVPPSPAPVSAQPENGGNGNGREYQQ